jgi:hypothetical protein
MTETSWAARQPSPTRRWNEPHDQLPLPLFLIAAAAAGVLFLAVLLTAQDGMCAVHATPDNPAPLAYCEGYGEQETP